MDRNAISKPGTTHFIMKVIVDMPFELIVTYPERVLNKYQPTKWSIIPSSFSLTQNYDTYTYSYEPGESWKIYKLVDGASLDFRVPVGPKAPPNCSFSVLIYGIKL